MSTPNAQQSEFWNGIVGQRWAKLQARTDLLLSNITEGLMPFAAARPGERVLDVGCGNGSTTLALAKVTGSAMGLDISVPLLDVARQRANGTNVTFTLADAASYGFKPEFDLVFSRFGVMFFDDPVPAFANIRKSLAPGGRMAFVCWRPFPQNAWAFTPFSAAKSLLPEQPPADPHAPGPFAFADADRTRDILAQAGFNNIRIEKLDTTANMGADIEQAADEALNIGPLSRAVTDLPDETRAKIRGVVKEALMPFRTQAGILPAAACWLVGATA